jgi:tetratricopeptide (TPR) repeat protein
MTVRWKPLLLLSGLFVVIAAAGLVILTMAPVRSSDLVGLARVERAAKRFGEAKIQYQRALQADGKSSAIHEEVAEMYGEWEKQTAEPERAAIIHAERLTSLAQSARFDKKRVQPRRLLLTDALQQEEMGEATRWAKEVVALDPKDALARYVLALELLDEPTPNLVEVRKHLKVVEAASPDAARTDWIKARIADIAKDDAGRDAVLVRSRGMTLGSDPLDQMALIRLRVMDVQVAREMLVKAERAKAFQADVRALSALPDVPSMRLARLAGIVDVVQRGLSQLATTQPPALLPSVEAMVGSIDEVADLIFKRALSRPGGADPSLCVTYANHLRFRRKRDRCLEVVAQGLSSKLAKQAAYGDAVNNLKAIAVEAALSDPDDAKRFDLAKPFIDDLLDSASPRHQGFAHLFQGAIDLEKSGLVGASGTGGTSSVDPGPTPSLTLTPAAAKLRTSAIVHLKAATELLPDVPEAEARYGVALILSQEAALGRQHLVSALRKGPIDAQYQIWAAWAMVQAGYPEEAKPVVERLLAQLDSGRLPKEIAGTVHLLAGEIAQSRRTKDDLIQALAEYDKAFAAGLKPTPAVGLRIAQIEVLLGRQDVAIKRIEKLRGDGQAGAQAEHLAVLTLIEVGKTTNAQTVLVAARKRYPESGELVSLEASLLSREKKYDDADAILKAFLEKQPDNIGVIQLRAQLLAEMLDKPEQARELLSAAAIRCDNSAPLVQLAILDLRRKDEKAVIATIAKIRARWKEAAAADLLDAQLAMSRGDYPSASAHFEQALVKDPGNKVVQFWKAQVDGQVGGTADAAKVFENLVREQPTKELDSGITLTTAAESALAAMSLESGNFDDAIARYTKLLSSNETGTVNRSLRWQLATAEAAKGDWSTARADIVSILNDAKNPPTPGDRVRAADFFRKNSEAAEATKQLDLVLAADPSQSAAVVSKASMLGTAKKTGEAIALLRSAISGSKEPPAAFFLMLAAFENLATPGLDGLKQAADTLDRGLERKPDSIELVQARYRVLMLQNDPAGALAFVEAKVKATPKSPFRRMLADVYRDRGSYAAAEAVVRELRTDQADDPRLAHLLVQLVVSQAVEAGRKSNPAAEKALNEKSATLIREMRIKFPKDLSFTQAEAELAARQGDLTRALTLTQQMDTENPSSPAGPLLRARLYQVQNKTREMADSYAEALERNPRQTEVRLLLAQARLNLGQYDDALKQTSAVLTTDQDRPDALVLQARGLVKRPGSPTQQASSRDEATTLLEAAIKRQPNQLNFYHQLAEVQTAGGQRDPAIATLKDALKVTPDDATSLSKLIELLVHPAGPGQEPAAKDLVEAKALAETTGGRDTKGETCLALAIGFQRGGKPDLALPWAEKAAELLDLPAVHLNLGDLLLAIAESDPSSTGAKDLFDRSLVEYDKVLKVDATSVEAVNNKAWILHSYLKRGQDALDLANAFLKKADPSTLPGEFFDTLGSIQEGMGQAKAAEETYGRGLNLAPDLAALNYHLGRLLAADRNRATKSVPYLEKAKSRAAALTPAMAKDVDALLKKVH